MILARLLAPEDFGLIAMVTALTGLIGQIRKAGLSTAIIQQREITRAQITTLFWISFGISIAATVVEVVLAPGIAWFYGEPRLLGIALALAAVGMFAGVSMQHRGLLRRQMRFGALSAIEILAAVLGLAAAIVAALLGAGYWALVYEQLAMAVVTTAGVWIACRWRPGRPRRNADVADMLSFGANLTGSNVFGYVARKLDDVLVGSFVGSASLGLYTRAYTLLDLPQGGTKTHPLTAISVSGLSRLQEHPERYRRFFRRALLPPVALGMPLVAFMFVAADELIFLFLGPQWDEAVPLFRLLAPAAFLGTFNVATRWAYLSCGRADRELRWSMFALVVQVIAMLIGIQWGVAGVAASVSVSALLLRYPSIWYCANVSLLESRDVLAAIWRPAVASLVAMVAAWMAAPKLPFQDQTVAILILLLAIYGVSYLLCWAILPGGTRSLREIASMLQELRTQRSGAEVSTTDGGEST
jgi:PST family polysaccharide transporter